MAPPLVLKFHETSDDLLEAERALGVSCPRLLRLSDPDARATTFALFLPVFLCVASLLGASAAATYLGAVTSPLWFILPGVIMLFSVTLTVGLVRARRSSRHRIGSMKEIACTFDGADIHFASDLFRCDIARSEVDRVIETPTLFLIVDTDNLAHVIPRRAFASDLEILRLREFLDPSPASPP